MRTIFTPRHLAPRRRKERAARKADDAHNADALEKLYNELTSTSARPTQSHSYKELCRKLGIPARRLESYIYRELGYRGEEFVQRLKKLE